MNVADEKARGHTSSTLSITESKKSCTGKLWQRFYFTGWATERAENLWAKSLHDGSAYPVTDFEGCRGNFAGLDTDGRYIYFTWARISTTFG